MPEPWRERFTSSRRRSAIWKTSRTARCEYYAKSTQLLVKTRAIPASCLIISLSAPPRTAATRRDAAEILGSRQAVAARELTKLHEQFARGRLDALAERFSDRNQARGEIVLLIAGAQSADDLDEGLGTASTPQALA